jgi:hypothetical protein
MGELLGTLITQLLEEYEQNKMQNWQKKTTLINLLITASISQYTYRHGATGMMIAEEAFENYL